MNKMFYLIVLLLLLLALTLTACGGNNSASNSGSEARAAEAEDAELVGDPQAGKEKFELTCAACHGKNGEGIPGLGKDMTTSKFIAGKTDQELVEFIKVGRDPSDPLNTTGVAMPPKGGNPALQEQDFYNIVAYIRTLAK